MHSSILRRIGICKFTNEREHVYDFLTERSWVKEYEFSSNKFYCGWVKAKVSWVASDVCE